MSGEDETGKAAELGRVLGAGQQRVGHRVGNTKQPLPDSAADAVIKKEWLTDGFGANSQNFFAERQKRGTSAAAVGFEHYTTGGGNTPYVYGDWVASSDDPTLVQWREFHTVSGGYELTPDHMEQDGVPRGTVTAHEPLESSVYPLTERAWWTYVPAQYDPATPAPVLFFQDGAGYLAADGVCRAPTVLDNLIAKGEIPPTIGVFLNPGVRRASDGSYHPQVSVNKMPDGREVAGDGQQRSFEYDSITDQYSRFLLDDVLPALETTAGLKISSNPEARGLVGISSSGVCAFAACWNRPDAFRKVISHVGSFTNIRGAHNFPYLVRTTPRKPLRVLMQSGSHDFDNSHGSWALANQTLAQSLHYAGYNYQFAFGEGGHNMVHGGAIFPDTLRYIWSDCLTATGEEGAGYTGGYAFGWQPAEAGTTQARM